AGGHLDVLATEHANGDRIPVWSEVAIELVGSADFERDGADEIEKGAVVERQRNRGCFGFAFFQHDPALRHDLESPLAVMMTLAELLPVTQRHEIVDIHPALEAI